MKMRKSVVLVVVLALLVGLGNGTYTAVADEKNVYTIAARRDAYISNQTYQDNDRRTFTGEGEPLTMYMGSNGNQKTIYMQFDLGSIDANHIASAQLSLRAAAAGFAQDILLYDLGDITWYEDTLTWKNAPVTDFLNLTPTATLTLPKYSGAVVYEDCLVDLTNLVKLKKSQGAKYLNLAFMPQKKGLSMYIQGKESEDQSNPPHLIIERAAGWVDQNYVPEPMGSGLPNRPLLDYTGTLFDFAAMNAAVDTNKICIFDLRSGTSTGMNQYKGEIVCDANGKIVKRGGNDNLIPEGGFVLSGHGTGRTVLESFPLGGVITFDEQKLKFSLSNGYLEIPFQGIDCSRTDGSIIVYTEKRGATTRTNDVGGEVVCDADGYVISIGGNNNAIPKDGFVLSGHRAGRETLLASCKLGASVTYDPDTMVFTVSFGIQNLKKWAEIELLQMQKASQASKEAFLDVDYSKMDEIMARMQGIMEAASNITEDEYQDTYSDIKSTANEFIYANTESPAVETRGVWKKPNEHSDDEVRAVVKQLKDANFNAIYLESFIGGVSLVRVREGDLYQLRPGYEDFDIVQSYIDACHEAGLSFHLWCSPLSFGGSEVGTAVSLGMKKPEWRSKTIQGLDYFNGETGKPSFFANVMNDEFRAYILDFYEYMLKRYDIDGLSLDYIRYKNEDFGYNEENIAAFESKTGYTVERDKSKIDRKSEAYVAWCEFRAEAVTNFVIEVGDMIRRVRPDLQFSASVYPNIESNGKSVMQNTPLWAKEGYLDAILPMSYDEYNVGMDTSTLDKYADTVFALLGTNICDGFPESSVFGSIEEVHQNGGDGFVWYRYALGLNPNLYEAAKKSVTRRVAVNQDAGLPAFTAQIDYIINRINKIIVPNGGMTAKAGQELVSELLSLKTLVGNNLLNNKDKAMAAVKAVTFDATEAATKKLNMDLKILYKIAYRVKPEVVVILPVKGDVNGDFRVDLSDVAMVARNMGKTSESPDWKQMKRADMNSDGQLNILDLAHVATLIK